MQRPEFTPAAGHSILTPAYDVALRLLTKERRWRDALLAQIAPRNGETILDVGCGTGTLAIMLKRCAPGARIVGPDPDPAVLRLAAAKARRAGVQVDWRHGFAHHAGAIGPVDHVVSALVFHQVTPRGKAAGLQAMFDATRPGGTVHIADYCRQPDWVMRQLFRVIQAVDGKTNTQANADGAVESLLADLAGIAVIPRHIVRTPTGAISLFRVNRSNGG